MAGLLGAELYLYYLQVDNQANLYGGTRTNVSTNEAIKWYLSRGATASKINMGEAHGGSKSSKYPLILSYIGIPLYGRSFSNTAGLGQPYDGVLCVLPRSSHRLDDILLVPLGWARNRYLPVLSSATFWCAGV